MKGKSIKMLLNSATRQKVKTNLLKFSRQFKRPKLPQIAEGEINLHLGCGFVNHPHFINIDALALPHIHYIRSIGDLSPFADNSVNLIYASHSLEHFSHLETATVLAEWFRVLKKGGTLRLSVPDFDLLVDIYRKHNNNVEAILHTLMGSQNYQFNFHMTAFNQASLERLLKEAGFVKIQPWEPGDSELTTFNDFSIAKLPVEGKEYPVSLNLEAIK